MSGGATGGPFKSALIARPAALPPPLAAAAERRWQRYAGAAAEAGVPPATDGALKRVLWRVFACSDYVAESCARDPVMLQTLLDGGTLLRACLPDEARRRVTAAVARAQDEATLMRDLRRLRRREWVRIAWRDAAGWANAEETMAELSAFADAFIGAAAERLEAWQHTSLGTPRSPAGSAQSLVVVAMGKLGAGELNFSSDVDLIFAFAEDGSTDGPQPVGNEEYFIRLGQRLIKVLSEVTADGFVFRTDMRLRPFGDAGPLAVSFDALEEYYQTHGRPWERYAMLRARPVTGAAAARARLAERLRPFVYRRYVDYTAFQELRDMKRLIVQEVARKGMDGNIKLGAGGIREVEFIVHTFQLIRGGRQPDLQSRSLLHTIAVLRKAGALAGGACDELRADYLFLRRLENLIQAYDERQTHDLPEDPEHRAALAYAMGYHDWPRLRAAVETCRRRIHAHFTAIVVEPKGSDGAPVPQPWQDIWRGTLEADRTAAALAAHGLEPAAEVLELLADLRGSAAFRAATERAHQHLDRLMPMLLAALTRHQGTAAVLRRLTALIERIGQRTAYLALLTEYPAVLDQLVKLFAASPWIAEYIALHPLLLDELIDPQRLYAPLDRAMLQTSLTHDLSHIPAGDLEQQMETLRHFKQTNTLRVAAADITGVYPLMVVSDRLTEIAETVLQAVLELAWSHLTARHGVPRYRLGRQRRRAGFAVIGYGKLGGIELGYGSDLDLVFLHDSRGDEQCTDGAHAVDNAVFYARLGQRIIHILGTYTPSGVLYQVDMRLRPSGASGLLVSGIEGFSDYQREQAWTWEHQALVRARPVAGDPAIADGFAAVRRRELARARDPEGLRREVAEMRTRMRQSHAGAGDGSFDLKQDPGGIADIEFMVQYAVLRWAREYPALLQWTDNVRLLDELAAARLLASDDARFLKDAYRFYRAQVHRLTLQESPAVIAREAVDFYRPGVARLWQALMETPVNSRPKAARQRRRDEET